VWQLLADTHVVILPTGDPIFVGGQVFGLEQPRQNDWAKELHASGDPGFEVGKILQKNGVESGSVGIVGMTDASLAHHHFEQLRSVLPGVAFVDATGLFEGVRQTNSDSDLQRLRETSQIFRDIYAELEPTIQPGMREVDLAAEAHRVSRVHGLRDPMVLLQTTPYGAMGFGTTKIIGPSDLVTVWIESAGPSGFWLEYRRTYSFGPASQEQRTFWDLQVEAVRAGLAALTPGAPAHHFAVGVQEVLEREGYSLGFSDPSDPHNMFSLHGIGTDAIQGVWVPGNDRPVKETEVVNIHPTVQFRSHEDEAKFGWLGLTDNAVITPQGAELLTYDPEVRTGFIEL
jgi:Xaa-Pro aminopeptidase